jgi:hypothetical protein
LGGEISIASTFLKITGNTIKYAVIGDKGPWVVWSRGGRRGRDGVHAIAERMTPAGY